MKITKKERKQLTKALDKLDKRTVKMETVITEVNDSIDNVWTLLEEMTGETFMKPLKILQTKRRAVKIKQCRSGGTEYISGLDPLA